MFDRLRRKNQEARIRKRAKEMYGEEWQLPKKVSRVVNSVAIRGISISRRIQLETESRNDEGREILKRKFLGLFPNVKKTVKGKKKSRRKKRRRR